MKYALGIIATIFALTLAAPAQAVTTPTTGQILQKCPDVRAAKACPPSAEWFLSSRPASALADEQIQVDLFLKVILRSSPDPLERIDPLERKFQLQAGESDDALGAIDDEVVAERFVVAKQRVDDSKNGRPRDSTSKHDDPSRRVRQRELDGECGVFGGFWPRMP